ncbi:MAG: tetratricopeptide repeat protein, partial [Candidatus Krumholzibacteriaceae bacterium]
MKRFALFASLFALAAALTLAPELNAQTGANPKSPEAQYNLGRSLWKAGKLDSALIHLKAARDLDKSNPDYLYSLGVLYLDMKMFSEAKQAFRAGLAAAPEGATGRFYYGLGRAHQMAADSLDAAIVSLLHAREEDPKNARVYAALGDAYAAQKIVPLALDNYKQAVDLDSTLVEAHFDLGVLLVRQRKYADALAEFRVAERLDPKFAEARY